MAKQQGTFDAQLAQALEEEGGKLLDLLRGALDAKKTYGVRCPRKCCADSAGFQAEFPDYRTMLEVAKFFAERTHGRPGTQTATVAAPKVDLGRLDELSDAQLAAIAAGGHVDEEVPGGEVDGGAAEAAAG